MTEVTRSNVEKALDLWKKWRFVRNLLINRTKESPAMFPLCECASPVLYWDESPSRPENYETEFCLQCANYTGWNRIKDGHNAYGWHWEQHIENGEVRFRSEKENSLLTEIEYADYVNFQKGSMGDCDLRTKCRIIANNFDIPIAKKLIQRRFGQVPDICKSQPDDRKQHRLITGAIFNKEGVRIYF